MRSRRLMQRILRDAPRLSSICMVSAVAARWLFMLVPGAFYGNDVAAHLFAVQLTCLASTLLAFGPQLWASRGVGVRVIFASTLLGVYYAYPVRTDAYSGGVEPSPIAVAAATALVVQIILILASIPREAFRRRWGWMVSELCAVGLIVTVALVGVMGSETTSENLGDFFVIPMLIASNWVVLLSLVSHDATTDWRPELMAIPTISDVQDNGAPVG